MSGDPLALVAGIDRAITPSAAPRSAIRSVVVPTEHGGWALTLEPGLLGLLIAPSAAGACVATAGVVAFALRTPTKLWLVDRRRGRSLARTTLARRVALVEIAVLLALVATALLSAGTAFWVPGVVAAPLIAVEAWYDVRSRSRRLVPELAGGVGVCSVVSMVVLAGGGSVRLAIAAWAILAARIVTSIPHVRAQIARLHGDRPHSTTGRAADGAALGLALGAVALDGRLALGALAIAVVVALQRLSARRPVPRAVVLGVRQMGMGLGVVIATAVGVLTTTS